MNRDDEPKWNEMAAFLAGEASASDEELNRWIDENPENRQLWDETKVLWNASQQAGILQGVDVDEGWSHTLARIKISSATKRMKYAAWSIVAMAVFIAGTIAFFNFHQKQPDAWARVAASESPVLSYGLADGSVIDLNRGGQLSFPSDFGAQSRSVKLEGEAFFTVQKQVNQPFVIHAGDFNVRVTGTSFNVLASLHSFEVSVVEGSVEISNTKNFQTVKLQEAESAVFDQDAGVFIKRRIENSNFMAWKTRRLEFRHEPLERVCRTLESVYGIRVDYPKSQFHNDLFLTATFSHDNLDYVMKVISVTLDVEFVINKEGYYLVKTSL